MDIKKIAQLAKLSVTAKEEALYSEQMGAILHYFEQISKVNTEGVEPLVTPTDMEQFFREDIAENWKGAEAAVANGPEVVGNLFKVPPVV